MSNRNTFLKIVLWTLALELVRNRYNNFEKLARQKGWDASFLLKKQKTLLWVSSLIYGVLISLPILYFFISLTQKITSVYPDTAFLKTNFALLTMVALSYCVSVAIIRFLLHLYIHKINAVPNFCRKVGLKVWDSAKIVGQTPRKGIEAAVKGTKSGIEAIGKAGKKTARLAIKGSRQVADKTTKSAKLAGKIGVSGLQIGVGLTSIGISKAGRFLSKVFKKNKS